MAFYLNGIIEQYLKALNCSCYLIFIPKINRVALFAYPLLLLVSRKFCLLIIEGTHPSPPNLMATEKYLAIIKN